MVVRALSRPGGTDPREPARQVLRRPGPDQVCVAVGLDAAVDRQPLRDQMAPQAAAIWPQMLELNSSKSNGFCGGFAAQKLCACN